MTIWFHMPRDVPERVAFAYSPLLEAVLSLHVLVSPKHHPVQHAFVRRARDLSADLRRDIATFAFAFSSYFPEFLFPPASGGYATFEAELDGLSELPLQLAALEFTRPLYGGTVPRDPAALDRVEMRQKFIDHAARLPMASQSLVRLALDDPATLLGRFRDLLAAYWIEIFYEEWARIEPQLARAVEEAESTIATLGLYGLVAGLAPEVRIDSAARVFWLERAHEHRVALTEESGLMLIPSIYVWPHVRVNCDLPWPRGLIYPAPAVAGDATPWAPPNELVQRLRSLGDDTRLRALWLIAQRPRSTQELAALVRLSEAAMSKHLRMLTEAGLLTSHREGYYVLYSLVPDHISALSPSLAAFLSELAPRT